MPRSLRDLIELGSPEAIGDELASRETNWAGPNGQQAQLACLILVTRELKTATEAMDASATLLQRWGIGLAGLALLVGLLQIVAALLVARS
jgi:hypothetical protein